ncbi:LETM1-like protein-domain-containing protein [Scheffersomyces coipomensis]|uniref:LETM1-like protein-domain-containing protein n=1 Tax=Scheffersomyces coipomensis TaxID=1788519 RepID=UPI00315C7648
MVYTKILQRSYGNVYVTTRSLSYRTSVRYPLGPSLHANINNRTINVPLINSIIRYQSTSSSSSKTSPKAEAKTIIEKNAEQGTTEIIKGTVNTDVIPVTTTAAPPADKPKQTLWEKVKHEVNHYYNGTKLLGYEMKVSTKLLFKYMSGYALSRRESNQLQRTLVDVIRLVPFSAFVLIPFAELLLPIALKLFPNLLPSTYESKQDRIKKRNSLSKTRVSASELIKKTMEESGLKLSKKITEEEKEAFVSFFDIIALGTKPTHSHLIKVARLFKNDQVLDNLSRPQLVAMTQYMSLRPFGTDSILRYQIRHRLLTIIKDDKAIDYEGVETLTIPELQIACSQRGIKSIDVSPARMRDDLSTWLDLRLRQKIPSSLLILSSTYTYGDKSHSIETYYDALLAVLSSIPDEVYNVAKLELSDDSKLKLNMLKEQEEMIQEENLREKDTVNQIKDNIKLDEYEDTANEGMKIEHDNENEPEVIEAKSESESQPESQVEPQTETKPESESETVIETPIKVKVDDKIEPIQLVEPVKNKSSSAEAQS